MALPSNLIEEFAAVFDDTTKTKPDTTCYGVMDGDDHVRLDGADQLTPVTLTVGAKDGDRVLVMIKNRRALVVGNVTHPVLFVGTLEASDAIIVNGYLTTNAERTTYNDTTHNGITFSNSGIGGHGTDGSWTLSASGVLTAVGANISGEITASSGWLGAENQGFHIDSTGIYSGTSKSSVTAGDIVLSNAAFERYIAGSNRILRMAIGSNFGVAADGTVYATGVEVSGKIGASSGSIAGFTIDGTTIYSGQHSAYNSNVQGVFISPDHISLGPNAKFDVTKAGKVTATDVDLTGVIKADTGYIGGSNGWTIKTGAIYSGLDSVNGNAAGTYIGTDGLAQVGPTANNVTPAVRIQNGVITAVGANISGTITASLGSVGGWTLSSDMFYKIITIATTDYEVLMQGGTGRTDMSTAFAVRSKASDVETWTDNFKVRYDGWLYARNATIIGDITANTGYIGGASGWTIKTGAIHTNGHTAYNTANDGIYIGTDHIACGNGGKFYVGQDGVPHCNGAAIVLNDASISSGYGASRLTYQIGGLTSLELGLAKRGTTVYSYVSSVGSYEVTSTNGGILLEAPLNVTIESTLDDVYLSANDGTGTVHISGALTVSKSITADAYNDLFGYRTYEEDNVSITSGGNTTVEFTINAPTGYIFIGYRAVSLANGSTNGANYGQCSIHTLSTGGSGTKLSIKIHNFASTPAIIKVTAVALFAKSTMTSV